MREEGQEEGKETPNERAYISSHPFFVVFVFYSVFYGDLFEGTVQILEEFARSAVVVVRVMLVVVVWLVWLRCWVGGRLSVTFDDYGGFW